MRVAVQWSVFQRMLGHQVVCEDLSYYKHTLNPILTFTFQCVATSGGWNHINACFESVKNYVKLRRQGKLTENAPEKNTERCFDYWWHCFQVGECPKWQSDLGNWGWAFSWWCQLCCATPNTFLFQVNYFIYKTLQNYWVVTDWQKQQWNVTGHRAKHKWMTQMRKLIDQMPQISSQFCEGVNKLKFITLLDVYV